MSGSSRLDVLRQLLLFFAACKLKTKKSNRFSIGACTAGGKVELLKTRGTSCLFTSNTEELATMLTESVAFAPRPCINSEESTEATVSKAFALESILSALHELHQSSLASLSQPSHYRVILIWSRSSAAPSFTLPPSLPANYSHQSSLTHHLTCTTDVLFLHRKPDSQEEVDLLHSIFSSLDTHCQAISSHSFLSSTPNAPKSFFAIKPGSKRPSSYIFEASLHSPAAIRRVLGAFVHLITPAHLRPAQGDLPSAPVDLASLPLKTDQALQPGPSQVPSSIPLNAVNLETDASASTAPLPGDHLNSGQSLGDHSLDLI